MTRGEARQFIVDKVTSLQGVKAVELSGHLAKTSYNGDMLSLLEELVSEGKIQEVQYILPNMDYRLKSFYLPGGTQIKIEGLMK